MREARRQALEVCHSCPALQACRDRSDSMPALARPHGVLAGQVVRCTDTTVAPRRPAWEGSPQRRARGRRWTKLRAAKLRANPLCETPDCRRPAETVDHRTPLAEGGAEYDWANLASLCRPHATEKNTADALRGKKRARGG